MNQMDPSAIYRENAIRGASPVRLVIILHDMLLQDLGQAIQAFDTQDIEERTGELKHALNVLQQLQGSLEMETGGTAAEQLDRFYDFARAQILSAQLRSDPIKLKYLVSAVSDVRTAWVEVEQRTSAPESAVLMPPPSADQVPQSAWTV
jgi:flagellar secretion chaperone FliS